MITLDMTRKVATKQLTDGAFTLEYGVLTLQVSLGTYSLVGKTVTASFSPKLVETGALSVVAGVVQIPITPSLVAEGINEIQLNIRTGSSLEQSPKMRWNVLEGILASGTPTDDPGILGTILSDISDLQGDMIIAEGDIDALENGKVDKVTNKGLSTNDFTDAFETKLTDLPTASDLSTSLSGKVDKVTGKELSTNDFTDDLETKLNGIEAGANNYIHPANHSPSIITQDANNRFVTDTEKSTWNAKEDASNKKTSLADNSDTFYPSQKAVKTAVDAKADKLYATNLVTNGDFSNGTTGWTIETATTSITVPKLRLTKSGAGLTRASQPITAISGHKYYHSSKFQKISGAITSITFTDSASYFYPATPIYDISNGQVFNYSAILTASGSGVTNLRLCYFSTGATTGDVVDFWSPVFTDLTAIFGAGNEPTAQQMDLLLAGNFTNSWFDGTQEIMPIKSLANGITRLQTQIIEKTSYGVITGLVTAQQTVADMTVKVSAGTIYMANGDRFTPSATASLAVTTADATNPRIDIVYVSSTGVVSYLAGTAGASPTQPSVPSGGQLLATILVTAGKTSILTADITQRKKSLWVEDWIFATLLNSATGTFKYRKNTLNQLEIMGLVTIGTGTNGTQLTTLATGYKSPYDIAIPVYNSSSGSIVNISVSGSTGNVYLRSTITTGNIINIHCVVSIG